MVTRKRAGLGWDVRVDGQRVERNVTWPLTTLTQAGLIAWLSGDVQAAFLTMTGKAALTNPGRAAEVLGGASK